MTKKKRKMFLQNGLCAGRWSCKNVNTENCNPLPDKKGKKYKDFVECDNYETDKEKARFDFEEDMREDDRHTDPSE